MRGATFQGMMSSSVLELAEARVAIAWVFWVDVGGGGDLSPLIAQRSLYPTCDSSGRA